MRFWDLGCDQDKPSSQSVVEICKHGNKLPLKMWTRASRWPWRTIVEFTPRIKGCCGATTTATPSGAAFQLFEIRRLLDRIPHYSPLWCHVGELLESHWPCIIIKINPNFFFHFPHPDHLGAQQQTFSVYSLLIPSGYHGVGWGGGGGANGSKKRTWFSLIGLLFIFMSVIFHGAGHSSTTLEL